MKYASHSTEETIEIGKKIAAQFNAGDIVLLYGELGAGKTTLVKGMAEYFGLNPNDVVSPTFTLMQIYNTNTDKTKKWEQKIRKSGLSVIRKLVHIDTYRLENEEQLVEIGAEDYLGEKSTVCLVEWPEKLVSLLEDKKILNIKIERVGESERVIKIGRNLTKLNKIIE
ncbi:MAG: tRNA (adenosine(37)-N6)-threonylcarbamoyltransferase complex ATPase subunit type 1 TsaE [Patescibacteria group bacterium]